MRFFGHYRPERDQQGDLIGKKLSPVKVKCRAILGPKYGRDRNKRLVLTCHVGDIIGLRPEKTRRELQIEAAVLYALLIRRQFLQKKRDKRKRTI